MIDPIHKTLTRKKERLKEALETVIQQFEDTTGSIYIESIYIR